MSRPPWASWGCGRGTDPARAWHAPWGCQPSRWAVGTGVCPVFLREKQAVSWALWFWKNLLNEDAPSVPGALCPGQAAWGPALQGIGQGQRLGRFPEQTLGR